MCNPSMTKGQQANRELAGATCDTTGNLPMLAGISPDYAAPTVGTGPGGVRELVMAHGGIPGPAFALQGRKVDGGVTNVCNTASPHWQRWMVPAVHCLVPFTSFSEPGLNAEGKLEPVWFALDENRPFAFFARVWTGGISTPNVAEGEVSCDLFAFLKTEPDAEVGAVHPRAMPVGLTEAQDVETWLAAPWPETRRLQRPLKDGVLRIVARGANLDGMLDAIPVASATSTQG